MSSQKLLTRAGTIHIAQSTVRQESSEENHDSSQRSDALFFGVLNLSSLLILVLLFSIFVTLVRILASLHKGLRCPFLH